MKKTNQFYASVRICMVMVICGFAGLCSQAYSQSTTQYFTSNEGDLLLDKKVQQIVSLKSILNKIEDSHNISFLFDNRLVAEEYVSITSIETDSLANLLGKVLSKKGLTYKKQTDHTYVIMEKPASDGPSVVAFEEVVSGKVTESTSGESLPGVNIRIKGAQIGATTDMSGNYQINAPSLQDTLIFTFVGFQTQEVPINGRTEINLQLVPQTIEGDELVVIGYGSSNREDLTGSISSVSATDLENSITSTFDQSLQGRTAGVMVMKNSGKPGGGVSMQIRGVNTLQSSSEPLYVIDGVPISGDSDNGITNPLATLNPSDIQSIDILKDASAAAIYGSRASNGVVLITTKRGQAGDVQVNYDGYVGIQQLPNQLDVMNLRQYAQYRNRQAEIAGWGAQPEFADPSILGDGTNWQDVLYRDAPMTKHNVSVSGGTESTQYMLSAGFFDQQGIAIESDFQRYSLRLNLDNNPTTWLKVGTSLNLSRTNENINVSNDDIVNMAIRQSPDIPVKYPDGSWGGPSQSEFTLENPVALAQLNTNEQKRSQVIGNLYAEIDFHENLTLRNEMNGTFGYTNNYVFNPTYEFNERVNDLNSSNRSSSNSTFWQVKNYMTYANTYQDLSVNAMVGHEVQVNQWEGLSGSRERFPTNNLHELAAGDAQTAQNSSYSGSSSLQSFFTRLNFTYDDRYLLTGNLRADGSSNFSEQNRWGYFPSVALAWRISNESFMQDVNFIDELKLRGGYGFVGNQNIPNNRFIDTFTIVETQWGNGVRPQNLGNTGLRWESTESINAGLDLSVLRHRINFTVDAYIKRTHDLLTDVPLPLLAGTSGNGSINTPIDNIGQLENKGIEFSVNTINMEGDFRWESDVVLSMNRNAVTELKSENSIIDRQINFFDTATRTIVGEPVGQLFGYVVEGVFEDAEDIRSHATQNNAINPVNGVWPGDLKFKDLNDDGIIDEQDRTIIGNPMPDFQYGITNKFFYKNVDFSVFLNGNYGNKIFNQVRRQNENPASDFGMLESVFDYARLDPNSLDANVDDVIVTNPETTVPRITTSDPNNNQRPSTRFVEDGTYLRIKNVTLGYTLPTNLASRFNLRNLRVYGSVENLHTFTGYSGYDPEIGSQTSDPLLMGIDNGRYPSQRIFTLGINIGL
ncbi:SusC/RagA family TonB-linked outer membrane protein [Fodinibius salsisoli]|uniref:TonB-dependent receptor n=1 Tax=Fodinibius salsisoli TaxID=2820877 RepID=A0ABT3PKQ3_9BACT|nr:TonB-dependent receptor [Fodinibius salsisoli]MCW9706515.1 TonB-dependent receptor [Fodinibius salsisoli]